MSDVQDRIGRLATEAQTRADVAGTQAAWQEGRAHGLREAAAVLAAAAEARTLRDDIRDYIADLEARPAETEEGRLRRQSQLSPQERAVYEAAVQAERIAWRQTAEDLRGLLAAHGAEGGDDE